MRRGTKRAYIKTRSGVSEIRIERRAIPAPAQLPAPVVEAPVAKLPDTWEPLGVLAENIADALRGRSNFPAHFYKGAIE